MTPENKNNPPKPTPPPAPPAGEEDIQERINNFNKELIPLLGKFELGLAGMAKIMPDGRVLADPIIVSVRKKQEQGKVVKQGDQPEKPKDGNNLENPDA